MYDIPRSLLILYSRAGTAFISFIELIDEVDISAERLEHRNKLWNAINRSLQNDDHTHLILIL